MSSDFRFARLFFAFPFFSLFFCFLFLSDGALFPDSLLSAHSSLLLIFLYLFPYLNVKVIFLKKKYIFSLLFCSNWKMSDAGSSRSFPLMVILCVLAHLRILRYLSGGFNKEVPLFFKKFLRFLRLMLSFTQSFDNLLVYPLLQNAVVYSLVSSIFLSCMGGGWGEEERIRM